MASEYRISSANHSRRTFASPKTRSNKGARNLISSSVSLTSNTQIDGMLSPVMALLVFLLGVVPCGQALRSEAHQWDHGIDDHHHWSVRLSTLGRDHRASCTALRHRGAAWPRQP